MYTFNWALTAFRSESYIGSATALPDNVLPYIREYNDQSFYSKLVAPTGRYIYGVLVFMGLYKAGII